MKKPNLNGQNGNGYQPVEVPSYPGCHLCGRAMLNGSWSDQFRCADCEGKRADANAEGLKALRDEIGLAKDQAEALREALDVANQEIKRLESAKSSQRRLITIATFGEGFEDERPRELFGVLERSGLAYSPEESVRGYATRVVEKLAEVSAQADAARRDARKWQQIAQMEGDKARKFDAVVEQFGFLADHFGDFQKLVLGGDDE